MRSYKWYQIANWHAVMFAYGPQFGFNKILIIIMIIMKKKI